MFRVLTKGARMRIFLLVTLGLVGGSAFVNSKHWRRRDRTIAWGNEATASSWPVSVVKSMPPPLPKDLKNNYYLLRHGQSTANVASVISSDRDSLAYTDKHDVTPVGYEQGLGAAPFVLKEIEADKAIQFISSPFARARSTARACLEGLKSLAPETLEISAEVVLKPALMERYFGRLDGEAIYTYAYVWPLDQFNVTHTAFDVESVAAVCHRIHDLIVELEAEYDNTNVVLVSHADVLQIAQLYAAQHSNVGLFSSYRFANAEVRPMLVGTTKHLPDPSPLEPPDRQTKTMSSS